MCSDPSPEAFGVSENARRPLAGDFRGVGRYAARGRRTFCTFFEVCSVTPDQILHIISSSLIWSSVTMNLAFPATAQSTNLLSSKSTVIRLK